MSGEPPDHAMIVTSTDALIAQLAGNLAPVRRLRAPAVRALLWLALCAALACALVLRFAHPALFMPRFAVPRIALETVGTALTAITATLAAFELSVPDGSPRWLWLPAPSLLLWLGASGLGCLRNGVSLGGPRGLIGDSGGCFGFIVVFSVPLGAGLFWLLRRARPIDPLPVAALGTLAVAATAAFVLQFFHGFDVTVIDLAFHLAAVGLLVLAGTVLRRPLLDAA
jgi:hypothetical protein